MQKAIKSTVQHCVYCFDVLVAALNNKSSPPFPSSIANVKTPLFVTYQYQGELRGCIGTFASQDLSTNLGKYALIAALKDTRFDPIAKNELKNLSVSVSLLINFQERPNALDWEVGKHGIEIQFDKNSQNYSGTFLPEVASQQSWSKQDTLKHLIRKAGYKGALNDVINDIKLTTYESSKTKLSYQQYQQIINSK